MAIIEVKNATKKFRESTALSDVTVSFEKGLIHGVIGRNGSGKTVLFKSICGLMHLTEGEILVRGKRVGKDIDVPPDIGIVIENPGFLPSYSGMRNLMYLAKIRNLVDRSQVEESMRFVGLDPKSKKHVAKYSRGCGSVLPSPRRPWKTRYSLLDEPMNGLDNQGVKEIREAIRTLKEQGKTILLASHNPLDIEELCDTVHEMDAV